MATNSTLTQFFSESSDLKLVTEPKEELVEEVLTSNIKVDSEDILSRLNVIASDISRKNNLSIKKSKEIAFYYFLNKISKLLNFNSQIDYFDSLISGMEYEINIDINEFHNNVDYLENLYSKLMVADKKKKMDNISHPNISQNLCRN